VVKEFVNPNLHVVLVHYPIALLFAGVLVELFSFLGWRRGGFRAAGRWMILLGTLTAVPTALSGLYAISDVARMGLDQATASGTWKEVTAASPLVHVDGGEAWEHMTDHGWQQAFATGILLLAVLVWLSCSDIWRRKLHVPILVLVLVGAGATAWGAWNAGEGVYRHGVGVFREFEGEAPTSPPSLAATKAATVPSTASAAKLPAASEQREVKKSWEYFAPPMQLHVIMAGFTISMAVVALGLAIRGATTHGRPVQNMDDLAAALSPIAANDPYIRDEERSSLREQTPVPEYHTLPSARFWLLAMLLGIITALGGAYLLAGPHGAGTWNLQTLWDQVRNSDQNPGGPLHLTRRLAHVISGSSIVVLSLLLAFFARFAPRARFIFFFLGLLLLAVVAAQVWLGTLLMWDTNSGPINAFN
jgi:uncharacterized membrane protein